MMRRALIIVLPAVLLLLGAAIAGRIDLVLAGAASLAILAISLIPAMAAWRSTSLPRVAMASGVAFAVRIGGLAVAVGAWPGPHRTTVILAIAASLLVSLVLESLCWPERLGSTANA